MPCPFQTERLTIRSHGVTVAAIERDDPARFQRYIDFMVKGYEVGAREQGRELGQRLQLEARSHHDVYDRLPSLTMPVYVCGGRYDGIAPPANVEAIARQIPGATLEMFEGGHMFMVQDRPAYPKMIEFLLESAGEIA